MDKRKLALVCTAALAFWLCALAFGGVTGDTSGFFLQMCELMMLFGAWIGSFL